MVARARKVLTHQGWSNIEDRANRWADNLKKCSCYMCCNPRHGWEAAPTFQELRQKLELSEELEELKGKGTRGRQ